MNSLLRVFLRPLLASAPVEPRLLHVAAALVRAAPPDEDGQGQDDQQKGAPQLELVEPVQIVWSRRVELKLSFFLTVHSS